MPQIFSDFKLEDSITRVFTTTGAGGGSWYVGDWKMLHVSIYVYQSPTPAQTNWLQVIWGVGIDDNKIQGQTQQWFTFPGGSTAEGKPFMFHLPILAPYVDINIGTASGSSAMNVDVTVSHQTVAPITPIGSESIMCGYTGGAPTANLRVDALYPYYGPCQFWGVWLPVAGQTIGFDIYEVKHDDSRNRIQRFEFDNGMALPPGFQSMRCPIQARGLYLSVDLFGGTVPAPASLQFAITPMPASSGG